MKAAPLLALALLLVAPAVLAAPLAGVQDPPLATEVCLPLVRCPFQNVYPFCNGRVTELVQDTLTLLYWDDRDFDGSFVTLNGIIGDDWVYLETNGRPGLQSGGSGPISFDSCDPYPPPFDMLIY